MVVSNSESDGTLLFGGDGDDDQNSNRKRVVSPSFRRQEAIDSQENDDDDDDDDDDSGGGGPGNYPLSVLLQDKISTQQQQQQSLLLQELFETCLFLPILPLQQQQQQQTRLLLPKRLSPSSVFSVDEYLAGIPKIQQSRAALFARIATASANTVTNDARRPPPVVRFRAGPLSNTPQLRLLYISQREVGHATLSEADVVLSDRATTCHILLIRSTTTSSSSSFPVPTAAGTAPPPPLVTCAHLDAPWYDQCLRKVFQRHLLHHFRQRQHAPAAILPSPRRRRIQVDIHVVGGFLDAKGKSRDLSAWLINSLADLAKEYASVMQCTLQTCVLTSANHYYCLRHDDDEGGEGRVGAPLCRGLACEVATGRVFLARCEDACVMGPDIVLRQARLWSSSPTFDLVTVHTENNNGRFVVPPFEFSSYADIYHLLSLPDDELLLKSSTSPDCEENDYCTSVRQALSLLLRFRTNQVFGHPAAPRIYRQTCTANQWVLCRGPAVAAKTGQITRAAK